MKINTYWTRTPQGEVDIDEKYLTLIDWSDRDLRAAELFIIRRKANG